MMSKYCQKLLLAFALFVSLSGISQQKTLDSLLMKIDNKQSYIVMSRTISPRLRSGAGSELIRIGKTATPGLIKILDSRDRGIIAHFILSEIWKDVWNEEICCNIMGDGRVEIVTINGLKIYIENNDLESKDDDLKQNKERWKKLVEA